MSILHNIFFFLVAIAVLVAFHEYGHYWVARKLGVKVLKFSIGFGKPLLSWKKNRGGDIIEYVIAVIPLGGYVKMLDEREADVDVDESDRARAFNNQRLLTRVAIVAAGPAFNFILAVILYWVVFVSGVTVERALLDAPEAGSQAEMAGFVARDVITKVGDREVDSWNQFRLEVLNQGLDGGHISVEVMTDDQFSQLRTLEFGDFKALDDTGDIVKKLGFRQWWPELPPIIGGVTDEGVAKQSGLQKDDLIVAINAIAVTEWQQVVDIVREHPGENLNFSISRDNLSDIISVIPGAREVGGVKTGFIGAYQLVPDYVRDELLAEVEYGVIDAIPRAMQKTLDMSVLTLKVLWKMLAGEASLSNISGPITIAKYAGITAEIGLNTFIGFLAVISVSLGVLNLLPIPMLDGGHLFYYLIESVKGTPVSESFEAMGQQIGVVILGALMFVALYNDIQRLLH